jgi:hypothetical protein
MNNPDMLVYWRARREHAWLLRAEGFTLAKVGSYLGVVAPRAREMVLRHERDLARERLREKIAAGRRNEDAT